ncbi:MAG: response regulator transcription factor [Bacteroidales bacterium]|nr:response regulator transcription factor [Bacteroidales bacterium]
MKQTKCKVLLVDDSENLLYVIKDYLELSGYVVYDFMDEKIAERSLSTHSYNLCIIDIMSKGRESFSLLQEIRKNNDLLPVIILTANTSKEDRIKAFKYGCDDYITKPFSIEELELRMRAILRRCSLITNKATAIYEDKIYHMGNFEFNFSSMQLIHPKKTRTLTRKEAHLLQLLLEHKNKLIPREIILKEIWGEEDHSVSRSMDVFLTKLRSYLMIDDESHILPKQEGKRKTIYEDGYEPLVEIVNFHGAGYMLKVREPEA